MYRDAFMTKHKSKHMKKNEKNPVTFNKSLNNYVDSIRAKGKGEGDWEDVIGRGL